MSGGEPSDAQPATPTNGPARDERPSEPDKPEHLGQAEPRGAGRWLLVAAAVMWSTSGFFAKSPFFEAWPEESRGALLAFWRALFALLILAPMVRRPTWSWRLAPLVVSFALMNLTYLTAMSLTTAANAIWLQSTSPIWVFLIGVLAFKERVARGDGLTLLFGAAGVGLILWHELQGESADGALWGLASGVALAGVVLSLRQLRGHDSAWLVALSHGAAAALFMPYVVYKAIWPDAAQLAVLALFGVFQMGLPYWLFARGLRTVSGHEASGVVLLEPVLVPVWVFLAWRHAPSYHAPQWWTLVGGALILTGLALRYGRSLPRLGRRPLATRLD